MPPKPTISGFFPFLNDWGTIGSLVTVLDATLQKVSSKYEIIIIDDGSDEDSKQVLRALQRHFPKLRVISHTRNRGYGGAIKDGIAHARYDWIFYTDGDAQYDPREAKLLVGRINNRVDIVNGYKIKRMDPWYRILAGKTYHYVCKVFFSLPIRDTDCDFRLMRKTIFNTVKLESNSGLICVEMIKKIADSGFKFREVPVHHFWRTSGRSQFFNFKRVAQVGLGLSALWFKLVLRKEHVHSIHKSLPAGRQVNS